MEEDVMKKCGLVFV